MELAAINGPAAAFVAGLVTSLHCVGMCGPLACLLTPARGAPADASTVHAVYQTARLAGYAALGALVGGLGAAPAAWLEFPALRLLPWIMAAYFVAVALRLGERLPRLALLSRVQLTLRERLRGRSPLHVAAVMGAATPLLPCGPLYFLVAASSFAGSAPAGAELMLAFGLGTTPLLWLAQANLGRLRARLTPAGLGRARSALAALAALVILWRLRADLGLAGPSLDNWVCH